MIPGVIDRTVSIGPSETDLPEQIRAAEGMRTKRSMDYGGIAYLFCPGIRWRSSGTVVHQLLKEAGCKRSHEMALILSRGGSNLSRK